MLHLGTLDESLLRLNDLYICMKSEEDKKSPSLCAVWRSQINSNIVYHPLDPDKDSLSPLAIEMLSEELPQLLQSLLVGVERAICRVPLDELAFPTRSDFSSISDESDSNISSPKRSIECSLKRREIITKNKIINNKYALKRITNKSEIEKNSYSKNDSGNCEDNNIATSAETISMPLFCLGGSFPHIDSDEESGDDLKNSDTGKYLITIIIVLLFFFIITHNNSLTPSSHSIKLDNILKTITIFKQQDGI